jgi:NADP-dependent 3-hydroxy acid dehydrogenase YdfG
MPIDDLDRLFNVNVRAPLYLTQLFIRSLIKNQGQIVFINSSVINQSNWLNNGAYAATKLALKAVTDSIRNEVNSKGVRVLGIYPGRTSSQMQKYVHSFEKKKYNPRKLLQPDDIADVVVSSLRLPRTAEVTDISIRPNKIS